MRKILLPLLLLFTTAAHAVSLADLSNRDAVNGLKQALEKVEARGGTALYDALVASADQLMAGTPPVLGGGVVEVEVAPLEIEDLDALVHGVEQGREERAQVVRRGRRLRHGSLAASLAA